MTPKRPSPALAEGHPRKLINEVEPTVEQRDRQRDPFRRGQRRELGPAVATGLLIDRPSIGRHVSWRGLHHPPPPDKVMVCWERVRLYGHSLWWSTSLSRDRMHAGTAQFASATMGPGLPR